MSTNEWFTPPEYVESVRRVLGDIDLDPASCEYANKTIKARRYYSKVDNGLMYPWHGRIYLNPPYGRTAQGKSYLEVFTRYLVEQYQLGNVTEAILLIPVNTATSWFPILWHFPICFPDFRIRFHTEQGVNDNAAFGTCFIYLGSKEQEFIKVFSKYGHIVKAIERQPVSMKRELWSA